jgi:hypothetical protein
MITDYSRDEVKKIVNDQLAPVQALRDYDIVKALMDGKKIDDICFDNRISRAQVYNIKKKYMR